MGVGQIPTFAHVFPLTLGSGSGGSFPAYLLTPRPLPEPSRGLHLFWEEGSLHGRLLCGVPQGWEELGSLKPARAQSGSWMARTGVRTPPPEWASGPSRSAPLPLLTAAPLPPARNCLLFEGVGEQTPHGNVSPTPGSQESLSPVPAAGSLLADAASPRCRPSLLQAALLHSGSGTPGFLPLTAETPGLPPACMC